MVDITLNIEQNVKFYDQRFAIVAPRNGRIGPLVLACLFFVLMSAGTVSLVLGMPTENIAPIDYAGVSIFGIGAIISGLMFYNFLKSYFFAYEALLLPEQQKIVLRRERTKKVVSEHPIDDIEVRIESVHHEDPSRTPMRWFTLFDTNRQKQIFAVRTAGPGGETYDTAELKEFFYEVMGKKQ